VIRVSAFLAGISVLVAGCSGMPTSPDETATMLSAAQAVSTTTSLDPALEHPGAGVPKPPTVVPTPVAPPSSANADPAPSTPPPAPPPPAPPAAPVEGACGVTPCAPPTTSVCPPGLVPHLGATVTCEPPVPTSTCPVGTHPVLGATVTCVPD